MNDSIILRVVFSIWLKRVRFSCSLGCFGDRLFKLYLKFEISWVIYVLPTLEKRSEGLLWLFTLLMIESHSLCVNVDLHLICIWFFYIELIHIAPKHEQRAAADQILRDLQANPDMWLQVVHILQNTKSMDTKFFALQVGFVTLVVLYPFVLPYISYSLSVMLYDVTLTDAMQC